MYVKSKDLMTGDIIAHDGRWCTVVAILRDENAQMTLTLATGVGDGVLRAYDKIQHKQVPSPETAEWRLGSNALVPAYLSEIAAIRTLALSCDQIQRDYVQTLLALYDQLSQYNRKLVERGIQLKRSGDDRNPFAEGGQLHDESQAGDKSWRTVSQLLRNEAQEIREDAGITTDGLAVLDVCRALLD